MAYRQALNAREAYRINAVILLGNGRMVAEAPLFARFWKFSKRKVLCSRYYEAFDGY